MLKPYWAAVLGLGIVWGGAAWAAEEERPEATQAQTEDWLSEHIVAWDDATKLRVDAKDCSVQVLEKSLSTVINFAGVLFPVEVLRFDGTNDAFVRVRVKKRYSGDYSMQRRCGQSNEWCEQNVEKWSPVSYYDFRVSSVTAYSGSANNINIDKADELRRAFRHYALLCGSTEEDYRF